MKFNDNVDLKYLSETLSVRGKVNFLETYDRVDVLKSLHKGLNSKCNQTLDSILGITVDKKYPNAIIDRLNQGIHSLSANSSEQKS